MPGSSKLRVVTNGYQADESHHQGRRVPLIGRTLRVRVDDGDGIAVFGELAGEEDGDCGLAAAALWVCNGENAWHGASDKDTGNVVIARRQHTIK